MPHQSQLAVRPSGGLLASLQAPVKEARTGNFVRSLTEADEAAAVQASLAHVEVRGRRRYGCPRAGLTAWRERAPSAVPAWRKQNQLASAIALRSPYEYVQWLQVYVRRLCRDGAHRRLRELLDDLRGPANGCGWPTERGWAAGEEGLPRVGLTLRVHAVCVGSRLAGTRTGAGRGDDGTSLVADAAAAVATAYHWDPDILVRTCTTKQATFLAARPANQRGVAVVPFPAGDAPAVDDAQTAPAGDCVGRATYVSQRACGRSRRHVSHASEHGQCQTRGRDIGRRGRCQRVTSGTRVPGQPAGLSVHA